MDALAAWYACIYARVDKLAPLGGNCLVSALALVLPMLGALRGFLGAFTGIPVAVIVIDMVIPLIQRYGVSLHRVR